jgi:hypothetical protein
MSLWKSTSWKLEYKGYDGPEIRIVEKEDSIQGVWIVTKDNQALCGEGFDSVYAQYFPDSNSAMRAAEEWLKTQLAKRNSNNNE